MSQPPEYPSKGKPPGLLLMLLIGLVSLLAGCGDSNEDFVFTNNNNNNPATTGNAVFQFVQAQSAVPSGTASFDFDFYSSQGGELLFSATASFANTVTVVGVPTASTFVVVTARDSAGHPLATLTGSYNLPPAGTINVTLSTAVPVTFDSITVSPDPVALSLAQNGVDERQLSIVGNFSNDESITFASSTFTGSADFTGNDEAVATVSTSGLVAAVDNGDTVLTVAYTVNGQERSTDIDISVTGGIVVVDTLVVSPASLQIAAGNTSAELTAEFTPGGGSAEDVTGSPFLTFALQAPVSGISVNNVTGAVTVDTGTADNTTAVVVATYDDGEGDSAQDTVPVTVGAPFITAIGGLPTNSYIFPGGTEIAPILSLILSDGTRDLYQGGDTYTGRSFDIEFSTNNASVVNTTAGGTLAFGNVTGDATILVDAGTVSTTLDATTVAQGAYVADLLPSTINVSVNGTATYQVVIDYGSAQQDITIYTDLGFTSGDGGALDVNPESFEWYFNPFVRGLNAGTGTLAIVDFFFLAPPGLSVGTSAVTISSGG